MSPRSSLIVAGLALMVFTAYTALVIAGHGYTGFLLLAAHEPWGAQMFVDLVIALLLFATWMRDDAASEGLPFWPYFLLILFAGSIGALAYLVHRGAHRLRAGGALAISQP